MDGGVDTVLRIGLLLPDLLGTYGDGGNARVLARRARARGIAAEILEMRVGSTLPDADLYLVGGGEDGPQRLACEVLRTSGLASRIEGGAHLFAVCAGLQLIGTSFAVAGNDSVEGLGIVEAVTTRGVDRSVGDLAVTSGPNVLVGFENHGGVTALGATVDALGSVVRGRGNNGRVDGIRAGRVWATYAHGPVLALNPWLADALLSSVLGRDLEPLVSIADELHLARRRALRV
jgi:CobQ-like glutamine amidotransferase family enzyme